jgi:hypothetical protein
MAAAVGAGWCQLPGRAFEAGPELPRCWQHLIVGILGWRGRPFQSQHRIHERVCLCIVVGDGHAISMLAGRDGSKRSNLDCILPESFEGDKVVHFHGVVATEDPHLVFFGEESHAVENTHANVDCVLVRDQMA